MSYSSEVKEQLASIEMKKECCRRNYLLGLELGRADPSCEKDIGAFMRGVFVKCGYIGSPERDSILTFALPDVERAEYISDLLSESGIPPKTTVRKGKPLLYYKKSEDIEDVISLCGGVKAALDMISAKVISDVRNNANRITNAETANLDRMARAAAAQVDAIKKIESFGMLPNLPPELRECAELRLANPDMSLAELRGLMREPVSKSGLNYRFKRLIETADEL